MCFSTYSVVSSCVMNYFCFYCYGDHRVLHSFPTRRSSDLEPLDLRVCVDETRHRHEDRKLTHQRARRLRRRRSEEHTSELQSLAYLVCRLLLEKKKNQGHPHGIHSDIRH